MKEKYRINQMKKNNNMALSKILFVLITATMYFVGCSPDVTPSLYDSVGDKGIAAEITSVSPESGYSGVTTITLSGNNFSPVLEENSVYFSSAKAEIISCTTTELVVKAPIILGDSLLIKVAKVGVENFSDAYIYKLSSAVSEYYSFLTNQEPYSATLDNEGNIYFSYIEAAKGVGVWQITPDGVLSEFAPKGGETTFSDLKYHSDGYLIGVYGNRAIFIIEAGVKPAVFVNTGDNSIKLNTFDFDKNKTIWAGGKGGKIVSVKPDKSFKFFDYDFEIAGLRVFDDHLYAISGEALSQSIVRFPIISPDSIGAVEEVFNFSANVETGVVANSLTFAADGQMYIALSPLDIGDPIDPIMFVDNDGSFGTWYPGLIASSASTFTWGVGTEMFIIRNRYPADRTAAPTFPQNIIIVDMERLGAPEFGRD
jgi:IPT/TIG domain